ncbi:DUF5519 family protein [filamentous cyanobacterium LEGE 11480]|uniref:DUF5519 family protein n=1 Tax=Romeriopsis navalis LEGE 11480 TaxID=2777977 RepID=A0A928VSI4_9CYAN|nr:DUF5519 family protein [Romeriopsis navalis LEGE 11480]
MSNLKLNLVTALERIPGITHQPWPERDDGFSTIHFHDREIAHFHNFNEIDLRLGRRLIKQEKLTPPTDSIHHPKRSANSQFLEMRFTQTQDIQRIVHLVKLLTGMAGA